MEADLSMLSSINNNGLYLSRITGVLLQVTACNAFYVAFYLNFISNVQTQNTF